MALLTPIIVFNATNFFGVLFGAKEKPQYGTAVTIVSAIMNVVLNYFLIQIYGIAGAAIATTLSRFFNIVVQGHLCSKVLNIRPDIFSIFKPLFASLVMVIFIYLIPQPKTIFHGLVEIVFAFLIYFAVIFTAKGLNRDDLKYFRALIGI